MDELPKAFVSSLRVLFEILDEDSDGFVELREIEKRWQGDTITGLPAGVVNALRSIAPKDGLLSFDRFCTGLKITLEKNRSEKGRQRGSKNSKEDRQPTTATVRPNNVVHPMRAKSAPQLQALPPSRDGRNTRSSTTAFDEKRSAQNRDPPDYVSHLQFSKDKSRRLSDRTDDLHKHQSRNSDVFEPPSAADRKRVEATLKSWQQEKRQIEANQQKQRKSDYIYDRKLDPTTNSRPPPGSPPGDNPKLQGESAYGKVQRRSHDGNQKGGRRKRDEPRRHTLSNGIDYNMLKRMKELEQERDTILQGLEAVELAKDWYRQQLAEIRDRQDRLNKAQTDFSEQDFARQDLVAYRTTRIAEVNRQLRALIATPEKSFPNHMNLAINRHDSSRNPQTKAVTAPPLVNQLKQQNKLLTDEVSSKSERISELEQEKAALIRQLFEARGKHRDLPDNTTFL